MLESNQRLAIIDRRRCEGCARANATRKHLGHSEHLRASDHANQARCAEPSCELAPRQKRRKTKHRGLSDVDGRTKFWRGFASGLRMLASPTGFEPVLPP